MPEVTKAQWRPKWLTLYFLLAAFDVVVVGVALTFNHQVISIYEDSISENRVWLDRSSRFVELGRLASAVDAPANEIFTTRDTAQESADLERATAAFEAHAAALRQILVSDVPREEAVPLLAILDSVSASVARSRIHGQDTLDAFGRGEFDLARIIHGAL